MKKRETAVMTRRAAGRLSALTQLAGAICAAAALLLGGCGDGGGPPLPVQALYSSAVHDARTVTPAKISRNLTPITSENRDLIWENGIPGSRLLVLSWIRGSDARYYDGSVDPACRPDSDSCTLRADIWVTVAPEMKRYFMEVPPQPLRIAQLLGVPPEYAAEDRRMVELWVSPRDLFRPCPDQEITDRECRAGFPPDPFGPFGPDERYRATEGPGWNVFMNYTGWFNNRKSYIYANPRNYPASSPYPWTRLGYTYDWGSPNHVGLSEFVVHGRKQNNSGISVGIRSLSTTTEYFLQ